MTWFFSNIMQVLPCSGVRLGRGLAMAVLGFVVETVLRFGEAWCASRMHVREARPQRGVPVETTRPPSFPAARSLLRLRRPWPRRPRPAAQGLVYLHGRKVLHRDIKSQNILLGPGRVPKLADFGVAKRLTSAAPVALTVVTAPPRRPGPPCPRKVRRAHAIDAERSAAPLAAE